MTDLEKEFLEGAKSAPPLAEAPSDSGLSDLEKEFLTSATSGTGGAPADPLEGGMSMAPPEKPSLADSYLKGATFNDDMLKKWSDESVSNYGWVNQVARYGRKAASKMTGLSEAALLQNDRGRPEQLKEEIRARGYDPDSAMFGMWGSGPSPMLAANLLKDQTLVPAKEFAQETVGRPIAETLIAGGKALANPPEFGRNVARSESPDALIDTYMTPGGSGTELLARQGLSWMGGDALVEAIPEKERLNAVNALEKAFGVTGAAYAQAAADIGGQGPMLLMGLPGELGKAAEGASALQKVFRTALAGGVEGGIFGGADAALKRGERIEVGAGVGAAMGVGGGALIQGAVEGFTAAAPRVAKAVKVLGVTTRDGIDTLLEPLDRLDNAMWGAPSGQKHWESEPYDIAQSAPGPTADEALAAKGRAESIIEAPRPERAEGEIQAIKLKSMTADFKPGVARVVLDKDGNLVGRFGQLNPQQNTMRYHDIPLNTPQDALKFGAYARDHHIGWSTSGDVREISHMRWDIFDNLVPPAVDIPIDPWSDLHPSARATERANMKATAPARRKVPKDLDALPVADPMSDGALVVNTPDGIRLEPMPPKSDTRGPAAPLRRGDTVSVHGQDGEIRAATFVASDANGNVMVRGLPTKVEGKVVSGKTEILPSHQVTLAGMDGEAAAFAAVAEPSGSPTPDEFLKWADSVERVNINKVQAQFGVTAAEAHEMLGTLVGQKKLVRWGPDAWTTFDKSLIGGGAGDELERALKKKESEDKSGYIPKAGEGVYMRGKLVGNEFEPAVYAKVIGPDPAKPGNFLVQTKRDVKEALGFTWSEKPVSMKADALWPEFPEGVARIKDLVPEMPKPPPSSQLENLTPAEVEDIQAIGSLVEVGRNAAPQTSMMARARGQAQNYVEKYLASHHRADVDLAQKIVIGKAVPNNATIGEDVFDALVKKFGTQNIRKQFDEDLKGVALGRLKLEDLDKYGEPWLKGKALFKNLLTDIENNSRKLVDMGYVDPELQRLRDAGRLDQYLIREYRAISDPNWAKELPQETLMKGVDYLVGEIKKHSGAVWSPSEVMSEVMDILRMDDPHQGFLASKLPIGSHNLKSRIQDMPGPIRALLGEETSGMVLVSSTIGKQKSILANLTLWGELAANKEHTSANQVKGIFDFQIPNNRRAYGDAAGMWTNKIIADSLLPLPNAIENQHSAIASLVNVIKFNQVIGGGPGPAMNNIMGNFWYSILAGGADIMRPKESGKALHEAVQVLRSYYADPSSLNATGAIIHEAKRLGVDVSGMGQMEIAKKVSQLKTIEGKVLRKFIDGVEQDLSSGHGVWDAVRLMHEKAVNVAKEVGGKATFAYDQIDRYFKLANYISLRKKFIAQGLPLEDACRMAAHRINQSFPNPQMVGEGIAKARQGGAGLLAPYLTFVSEDTRINASLAIRGQTMPDGTITPSTGRLFDPEEKDLKWRVMGSMAALYGILGPGMSAVRKMNGITDEDVEAAKAQRTINGQAFRVGLIAYPFWFHGKDKNGKPTRQIEFFDATQVLGPLRYFQGHPDDSTFKRVIGNFFKAPFEGASGEDTVDSLLEKTGLQTPLPDHRPMPGSSTVQKWKEATKWLWEKGLIGPTYFPRAADALRKGGVIGELGKREEGYTGAAMAQKLMGVPITPPISVPENGSMGPTGQQAYRERKFKISELEKSKRAVAFGVKDKEERRGRIQEINDQMNTHREYIRNMHRALKAAKASHSGAPDTSTDSGDVIPELEE